MLDTPTIAGRESQPASVKACCVDGVRIEIRKRRSGQRRCVEWVVLGTISGYPLTCKTVVNASPLTGQNKEEVSAGNKANVRESTDRLRR